jgi:mono/diheme cytochrome c family protein
MAKRLPVFWTIILTFIGAYLFLWIGVPYISMLITNRDQPLPVPGALMAIYLALIGFGLLVYLAADDARLKEFWEPVEAFFRGPAAGEAAVRSRRDRILSVLRWAVLVAIPLLVGWLVYRSVVPTSNPPAALRTQHPTIPFDYQSLTNPYRNPDGTVDPAVIEEGRMLYQLNCRPCHGTPADGNGPLAYGFRLRPANFRSEDTIATVVEAYAFWRIKEGGIGLPPEGSPWDSAMPAWKDELTDDQIWKIIAAEYAIAEVQPRRPEEAPGASRENSQAAAPALAAAMPAGAGSLAVSLAGGGTSRSAPQAQANGEAIYQAWCGFCHGDAGDGKGPVASYLNPKPRDFTSGLFKFRTTASGELPLRDDVIAIVQKGVHGTAMPAWEEILTQAEIEAVVDYITQTFVSGWGSFEPVVIPIPDAPRATAAMIEEGKNIYQELQCWKCHGQAGHADGPSAPTLQDDYGNPIRAADLTKAWRYKGGSEMVDIFTRFSTGMDGTPMPSFYDVYSEEEREPKLWALSAYVKSLQANQPTETSVITASRISGELPTSPDDPAWGQADPISIYLTGQAIAGPRWQIPGVDGVTVRGLHNDESLALLVEWDDPFQNTEPAPQEIDPGSDTYVNIDTLREAAGEAPAVYPDALAVQMPQALNPGPQKPYMFWGNQGRPVNVWKWQADGQVGEFNAAGYVEGLAPQEVTQVTAEGTWADGHYRLVLTRPLATDDPNDVQLVPGGFTPIAFQAWEGSNGETGTRLSLSSWYSLFIEKPVPVSVYLYSAIALVAAAIGEWALVRRARKNYDLSKSES